MSLTLQLNSGHPIPIIGLGTWQSKPGEVAAAIKTAVAAGYRHIDCAHVYQNQKEVGEALKELFDEGKVKREELFITSKVWNTFHSTALAHQNIDTILADLQLSYVDLILIHWPQGYAENDGLFPAGENGKMRYSDVDYLDTWKALETAQKAGKARSIGLSNFNHKQIQRVWDNAEIKPACLQVELHPYFTQTKLRQFCKDKGIVVVGYSPLGNPGSAFFRKDGDPNVLTNETVAAIAKAHGKTPAQIVLRWFIDSGISAIPKSVTPHRITENHSVFDFKLSAAEIQSIDNVNKEWRLVDPGPRDGDHPHFGFNEEF
uniref:Aldo_ket_red domain-containing protein n=1 Tax=Caenorhabditis japonica TaxID=281687 RepID=A0A8R1DI01_CAEJA